MAKELAHRILQQYDLTPVVIHAVQSGYRNQSFAADVAGSPTVNLILYKREVGILDRIHSAHYVSSFLASQGLPVRQQIDPRIMRLKSNNSTQYAGLYNYLPGKTIPWEGYTMSHIKQLGKTMSDMHCALQALPQGNLPSVLDECRALLKRMERYFAEDGVRAAMTAKLGLATLDTTRLKLALTTCENLPCQALHMDFVRGNILFDETAHITGILDFEKAAYGPPILDIARTLAFLIVDCKYKEEPKVRKYFLHSGYNKRGQSQFQPTVLLEDLLGFFLLYDLYKFLRHNPYESLAQNEHFVRTRDFLLKRNMLSKTEMLQYA